MVPGFDRSPQSVHRPAEPDSDRDAPPTAEAAGRSDGGPGATPRFVAAHGAGDRGWHADHWVTLRERAVGNALCGVPGTPLDNRCHFAERHRGRSLQRIAIVLPTSRSTS